MQRFAVVCRRTGLVTAGLVSVGLGVRGTAMLVRPGEIEFVPTGVLIAFVCLLALPLLTLWAIRIDNRTAVRTAVDDACEPAPHREPLSLARTERRVQTVPALTAASLPSEPHRVVHAAQSRRDRAAAHRIGAEVDRMLAEPAVQAN